MDSISELLSMKMMSELVNRGVGVVDCQHMFEIPSIDSSSVFDNNNNSVTSPAHWVGLLDPAARKVLRKRILTSEREVRPPIDFILKLKKRLNNRNALGVLNPFQMLAQSQDRTINEKHRSILLDWHMEVSLFPLSPFLLHQGSSFSFSYILFAFDRLQMSSSLVLSVFTWPSSYSIDAFTNSHRLELKAITHTHTKQNIWRELIISSFTLSSLLFQIACSSFQLLGCTMLMIACKVVEDRAPSINNFVWLCDHA